MDLSLIRRTHVISAIAECNRLGEARFLASRNFKPSQSYLLRYRGRLYPSKAIVGAAFEYATGSPTTSKDFSGGQATVQRVLEDLDFTVHVDPIQDAPVGPAFDGIGASLVDDMSSWVRFSHRDSLERQLAYVGVYLIAVANGKPRSSFPLPASVVYIGETSRTLATRLREFEKTAFGGRRRGHSGAVTFREENVGPLDKTFLQVIPVRRRVSEQRAMVSLIERYLIWSYARAHKRMPLCNSK